MNHAEPEKDILPQEMEETAVNFSRLLYNYTWVLGDDLQRTALNLSDAPENDPNLSVLMENLYVNNPGISFVFLTDANNDVISAVPSDTFGDGGYQIPGSVLDIGSGSSEIYVRYFLTPSGEVMTCLISPIHSSDGSYQGAIGAAGDLMNFFAVPLEKFQNETGYDVWIVDDSGAVLYSIAALDSGSNILEIANSTNDTEIANVYRNMVNLPSGFVSYAAYDYGKLRSTERIAAWNTVDKKDGGSITIIVTTVKSDRTLIPVPSVSTDMTLEEFVRSAYLYAANHGRDAALAEFNSPSGQFTTQEYYVIALDRNGTLLAHPYLPESIGHARESYLDQNGVPVVRMFELRASQGGGYVMHVYPNYLEGMHEEVKLSYVLPVDDEWYVVAGKYLPDIPMNVSAEERVNLVRDVRGIVQFAHDNGKEAALKRMNDPTSPYYNENRKIMALDYNGTILAWPYYPDWVGSSAMGFTDVYGASFVRDQIITAKSGGGFQYIYLPLAGEGRSRLQLHYALPVDDEWFVTGEIILT